MPLFNPMKTLRLLLLTCALAILGRPAVAQTTVTITATDASAAETPAGQTPNPGNIRISRTGSTASQQIVWIKDVTGLAVRGVDYTLGINVGGIVIIPAGSAAVDIAVNVIDDFLTEGTEDVRIKLDTEQGAAGTPVPYTIGGSGRATVNIADNEDPLAAPRAILSVAAVDATATETAAGTDPAVFRITRANNLTPALNVLYSLGGTATAGVDYTNPPATITIPAGVASVDVTIAPIDDPRVEVPETVIFNILPTDVVGTPSPAEAYAIGAATATATIVSDDVPAVTITTPGPNAAAAAGKPVTVNFTASDADGYIVSYSVLNMIKKLSLKDVISYEKYHGVNVTTFGKTEALLVIRKHRLWETFLVQKLGFTWDEVHQIAEQLEHIHSVRLIDKLDEFLGFPKVDPHGDPIPDGNGKIKAQPQVSLDQLKEEIGRASCRERV